MERQENIKDYFLKKEENNFQNNEINNKEIPMKANILLRKNSGDLPITNYSFKDKSKMLTKLFGRISQL